MESLKNHSIPSYVTYQRLEISLPFQICDCCIPTLRLRSSQVSVRKESFEFHCLASMEKFGNCNKIN